MNDLSKSVSPLEDTIVRLPTCEPASLGTLELSGDDLTRNTLLTGSVGSGKTSTQNRILFDVIHYRASDPKQKIGLLVLDFKEDETLANIESWCEACGRSGDITVIDAASPHHFNPMENFTGPADVDPLVDLLVSTLPRESRGDSSYFEAATRKRLKHFLTAFGAVEENPSFIEAIRLACQWLGGGSWPVSQLIASFKDLCDEPRLTALGPSVLQPLLSARDGFDEWEKHDARTKSNEASTITNHFSSFLRDGAIRCLDGPDKGAVDLASILDEGRIVVVRVPGSIRAAEAAVVGRVIKGGLYDALNRRKPSYASEDRLVGMFCDEAPLILTDGEGRYSDITQLALLRARRFFFVGGIQGFSLLDRKIGGVNRDALVANVNNWFFFRNQEKSIAEFASPRFGQRVEQAADCLEAAPGLDGGATLRKTLRERAVLRPNCSLEVLAALRTHQCFVQLSSRPGLTQPIWLEPLYSVQKEESISCQSGQGVVSFRALRGEKIDRRDFESVPLSIVSLMTASLQRYARVTGKSPDLERWNENLDCFLGACGDKEIEDLFYETEIKLPDLLGPFPFVGVCPGFFIRYLDAMNQLFFFKENPLTAFAFRRGILICERALSDRFDNLFDRFVVHLQDVLVERAPLDIFDDNECLPF